MTASVRVAVLAAGLLGLGSAGAGASPAEWRVFASQAGRFQVEFPEHPRLRERERGTPLGSVVETKHIVDLADETHVAIEVHDMPWLATRLVPSRSILSQVQSGVLEDTNASLIESREASHQGEPAVDFTFRLPNLRIERALAILVDSRLYILTGRAPDRTPDEDAIIRRFFGSFEFWREEEPPSAGVETPGSSNPEGRQPAPAPEPGAGAGADREP